MDGREKAKMVKKESKERKKMEIWLRKEQRNETELWNWKQ